MASVRARYADGTDATAPILPIHTIVMERKFGDKVRAHQIECSAFVAWLALGKPGETFDGWLANVVELDQADDDGEPESNGDSPASIPTQPGVLTGES